MSVRRILFFAEGATMTHFVRPLALAESLDPTQYDIHFYAPARYSHYLQNKPFVTGELASMPAEQFLASLAKGAPIFSAAAIRGYVQEDRKLIRSVRPDLIIGDMRLSLPISTRLEGATLAVIFNAYWSPFARRRFAVPSVPITRVLPVRWFGPLYKAVQPLAYRIHAREMNLTRRQFGIPDLPPDLRVMYTEGDYVLYPDIPEFVPTYGAPKTHHYVGTCSWTPLTDKPEWWDRMRAGDKPKVFISLGSSGPLEVLPALLRALAKLPVSVLISTSGRRIPATDSDVYTAPLLPFTETARECSLVISHGGSGGLYPAIEAGTPVLGIPSNADQHLSTAVLQENGAGFGIRIEEASEKRLREAIERLLDDSKYRDAARHWAIVFARYDSGELLRKFLSEL